MSRLLDDEKRKPIRGRKAKRVGSVGAGKRGGPSTRETLRRTARRVPEVMVKISGSAKNMIRIRTHVDYISRKGTLPLEDESGLQFIGKDATTDALYTWAKGGQGVPESGDRRRESFNIVFSMPPGTEPVSVKAAVRHFAAEQFGDNHQYVFAAHNDNNHPHVHLIVKASGFDGRRLNPRKADLRKWREGFAEKLRGQGIDANATPRPMRGITKASTHQAIWHINDRASRGEGPPARVTQAQIHEAKYEVTGEGEKPEPWRKEKRDKRIEKIRDTRDTVMATYSEEAKSLLSGDASDRALAVELTQFVRDMPAVESRHEKRVKAYSKHLESTRTLDPENEK